MFTASLSRDSTFEDKYEKIEGCELSRTSVKISSDIVESHGTLIFVPPTNSPPRLAVISVAQKTECLQCVVCGW